MLSKKRLGLRHERRKVPLAAAQPRGQDSGWGVQAKSSVGSGCADDKRVNKLVRAQGS